MDTSLRNRTSEAIVSRSMKRVIRTTDGDEYDALTRRVRQNHKFKPGKGSRIKRKFRRREGRMRCKLVKQQNYRASSATLLNPSRGV
jgi:hypothetical protein